MTSRERLLRTLRGEPVDRPAVNLYEVGGFTVDRHDPDPYNVYNGPTWAPLLDLAENDTDVIRMVAPGLTPAPGNPRTEFFRTETWEEGDSRFSRTVVEVAGRTLTQTSRRDAVTDTVWTTEHLLKGEDDLRAYLQIPEEALDYDVDVDRYLAVEAALGDRGLAMLDSADALCHAAQLFAMEDYLLLAFGEPELFHRLLERFARYVQRTVEAAAALAPGRLWRTVGPEFATEPYLPPRLFEEYVVRYDEPLIRAIQASGGYSRLHCHGRISKVMPLIASMGPDGLDPCEPPPQGDADLAWLRKEYGRDIVLFGNLEVSDIETMPAPDFEKVVRRSLRDGTAGHGRGFVLMPTASPYGREIPPLTMENYSTIVRLARGFAG
jgi:hypothetical protein